MPIKTRRVLLELYRQRYLKCATKSEKSLVLNKFVKTFKYKPGKPYSRKYAIKVLRGHVEPHVGRPGPKPTYGPQVVLHLKNLWELMGRMCSKKMVVALKFYIPHYKGLDRETETLIGQISSSTIDRLLRPYKRSWKKGLSTTKPSAFRNMDVDLVLNLELKHFDLAEKALKRAGLQSRLPNLETKIISVRERKLVVASLEELLRLKLAASRPQDIVDAEKIKEVLNGKKK